MTHSSFLRFLVGCVLPVLGCAAAPGCENTVLEHVLAPAGDLKAVIFSRNCGATTGFSTQVSVLTDESTPAEAGNVFIADTDHGRAPADTVGGPIVRVSWRGTDTLVVRHHTNARVFRAEQAVNGVAVVFVSDSLP